MSAADDRQTAIEKEVEAIRNVYRMNNAPEVVTLFAEDYDFLTKREQIKSGRLLENRVQVRRGQRKKKVSRRRPKESLFE